MLSDDDARQAYDDNRRRNLLDDPLPDRPGDLAGLQRAHPFSSFCPVKLSPYFL